MAKSKTLATWIALIGGSLGLHRFYLHGPRDVWGWLWPVPTLIGAYGVLRVIRIGQDDPLSWALIPLLGIAIAAAMLAAIVYGLMPDEKWSLRFNHGEPVTPAGWLAVIGDSANAGSVGVHRAQGFVHTGLLKASGWKFGRWLDVVLMQRALGPGNSTEPADEPA